ncbi:MAG: M81 family metallopeptidase [Candidatus Hydrogenedentes bacterium]|nr:M81 family metallopeptidase [Candidatus Hydrogenedentota bacterium]
MKPRVGIIGFMHESNTFASTVTERRHFEEAFLHAGPAIVPVWKDAHHELGGFLEGCANFGLDAVPLVAAWATPGGPVTRAAYESIVTEILAALDAAGPLDGLLVALHGAMVCPDFDDADGETLERIRARAGSDIPIVLSLDMHGNVSPRIASIPDTLVAYRAYPHTDQRQRGVDCARILAGILRGKIAPRMAHVKLPLLIHIVQQFTGDGPMAELYAELEALEAEPGIVTVSLLPGYIYADVPFMGVSVLVTANGDAALAEEKARQFADRVYERRAALNAGLPDVDEAVQQTLATEGAVCLMDSGDNIGGGGPGDSTILFAALRAAGVPRICAVFYDPDAARACTAAGEGAGVALEVGAKTDALHGAPVSVRGTVTRVHSGRFIEESPRHGGTREYDQGQTAVLATDDGHTVVLNSLRVMPTSLEQLLSLGIDPGIHRAIIVKGVTAPRAAYDPIAARTICVDTPGVTRAGPEAFVYTKRPHPLYPLDP